MGEDVQRPVERGPGPALGALQPEEVRPPPQTGGQKAAEPDAHDLGDGEALAHIDELAYGTVREGREPVRPVYSGEDVPGHGLALLDRRLCVRGDSLPVLVYVGRAVIDAPDVVVALDARVGVDHETSTTIVGRFKDSSITLARPPAVQTTFSDAISRP